MTTAPKFELSNLKLEEGSLVDKGDNPPAKVVFFKGGSPDLVQRIKSAWGRMFKARKNGDESGLEMYSPRTTAQIMAMNEFHEKFCSLKSAFMQSVHSIMESSSAEDLGTMLQTTVAEFSTAASALAKAANFDKSADLAIILSDLNESVTKVEKRETLATVIEKLEHFAVPETSTNKGDGAPVEQPTKEKGMDTKTITLEEALKGITDPAIKAAVEAGLKAKEAAVAMEKQAESELSKRLDAAEKTIKDANAQIDKLLAEKAEAEFMAKARKLSVPGQTIEEVRDLLKASFLVSKEAGEKMEKSLTALSNQAKLNGSITKSIGSSREATPMSATDQLNKSAAEFMKSDPKLTHAKAFTMAMAANRELAKAAVNGEV